MASVNLLPSGKLPLLAYLFSALPRLFNSHSLIAGGWVLAYESCFCGGKSPRTWDVNQKASIKTGRRETAENLAAEALQASSVRNNLWWYAVLQLRSMASFYTPKSKWLWNINWRCMLSFANCSSVPKQTWGQGYRRNCPLPCHDSCASTVYNS